MDLDRSLSESLDTGLYIPLRSVHNVAQNVCPRISALVNFERNLGVRKKRSTLAATLLAISSLRPSML